MVKLIIFSFLFSFNSLGESQENYCKHLKGYINGLYEASNITRSQRVDRLKKIDNKFKGKIKRPTDTLMHKTIKTATDRSILSVDAKIRERMEKLKKAAKGSLRCDNAGEIWMP